LGASDVGGGADVMAVLLPILPVTVDTTGTAGGNNTERLRATDLASHANLLKPLTVDSTAQTGFACLVHKFQDAISITITDFVLTTGRFSIAINRLIRENKQEQLMLNLQIK